MVPQASVRGTPVGNHCYRFYLKPFICQQSQTWEPQFLSLQWINLTYYKIVLVEDRHRNGSQYCIIINLKILSRLSIWKKVGIIKFSQELHVVTAN
jgi:hypothetical protein